MRANAKITRIAATSKPRHIETFSVRVFLVSPARVPEGSRQKSETPRAAVIVKFAYKNTSACKTRPVTRRANTRVTFTRKSARVSVPLVLKNALSPSGVSRADIFYASLQAPERHPRARRGIYTRRRITHRAIFSSSRASRVNSTRGQRGRVSL